MQNLKKYENGTMIMEQKKLNRLSHKNLCDSHDLFVQIDTLLLTDVF